MSDLKRLPIKYIRDRAKSNYPKDTECFVCKSNNNLDFHHFSTLDYLWDKWCKKNNVKIESVEDILINRDKFISEHEVELYEEGVTICSSLHKRLHGLFGQKPYLSSAPKQKNWINKKKLKYIT